jgi:hypothetical protein
MGALTRRDLSRFLVALDRRVPFWATLILTDGGEAMVLGGRRPTGDLDFGIRVLPRYEHRWPEVEAAVVSAAGTTGVTVQFSADIDRWSAISVPPGCALRGR